MTKIHVVRLDVPDVCMDDLFHTTIIGVASTKKRAMEIAKGHHASTGLSLHYYSIRSFGLDEVVEHD